MRLNEYLRKRTVVPADETCPCCIIDNVVVTADGTYICECGAQWGYDP